MGAPSIAKMGPWTDGGYIGTQAFFTNFTEIRFLCEPESTITLAVDAPLPGSKSQTNTMRAAEANPIQVPEQLEPLPNATVVDAERDKSENDGNPSSTQRLPNQLSTLQGPQQGQTGTGPTLPRLLLLPPMLL